MKHPVLTCIRLLLAILKGKIPWESNYIKLTVATDIVHSILGIHFTASLKWQCFNTVQCTNCTLLFILCLWTGFSINVVYLYILNTICTMLNIYFYEEKWIMLGFLLSAPFAACLPLSSAHPTATEQELLKFISQRLMAASTVGWRALMLLWPSLTHKMCDNTVLPPNDYLYISHSRMLELICCSFTNPFLPLSNIEQLFFFFCRTVFQIVRRDGGMGFLLT